MAWVARFNLAPVRGSPGGLELGRYADVVQAGVIRVGDPVEVLAPRDTG